MRIFAAPVALALVLSAADPVSAGEIILRSGQAITGTLAAPSLAVAAPSGVIEVAAEQIAVLMPGEVRLRDGQVIAGEPVGGLLTTIIVGGKVRGNLNATGRVEILPQGVLTGNLKTGSFAAADGALVKGEIVVERGGRGRGEQGSLP